MAEVFKKAGKRDGLEIWRIENLEPVAVPSEDYGKFHIRDCYIILETIGKRPHLRYRIYFWIGDRAEQKKFTAAACHSILLAGKLKPISLLSQRQNEESERFCGYFDGVVYLEGGTENSRKTWRIDPKFKILKKLYEVLYNPLEKHEVEFSRDSIEDEKIYILDAYYVIYIFINREYCYDFDRVQARTLANGMRKMNTKIIVMDFRSTEEKREEFFDEFDSKFATMEPEKEKLMENVSNETIEDCCGQIRSEVRDLDDEITKEKLEEIARRLSFNAVNEVSDAEPIWYSIVYNLTLLIMAVPILWFTLYIYWDMLSPYIHWLINSPLFTHSPYSYIEEKIRLYNMNKHADKITVSGTDIVIN